MEIFDLFFWFVGKFIHKSSNRLGITLQEMSDGGYTTAGFFATCFIAIFAFIIWGLLNANSV